jgi:hypothetical protein
MTVLIVFMAMVVSSGLSTWALVGIRQPIIAAVVAAMPVALFFLGLSEYLSY